MILRRECPCCGRENTDNEKIFNRDFEPCRELTAFSRYDVYICRRCGMAYAGNIEESMPLDEYYKRMSRYEGESFRLLENQRKFYLHCVEMIKRTMPKEAYILDVGCGFGGLLNELKKIGYQNLYGLEPSKRNCDYAMKEYGITVYEGVLGDDISELRSKKFDLLILSGVLEHLADVKKSVELCHSCLKKEGKLLVAVPDVDLFIQHEDLYQEFSVEHINYFDIGSLENVIEAVSVEGRRFKLMSAEKDESSVMGLAGNLISLWELVSDYRNSELLETFTGGYLAEGGMYGTENMERYLASCRAFSGRLKEKMSNYHIENGYYIWGAGTNTAMLVQEEIVGLDDIRGIFDSNRNYEGLTAYKRVIQNPKELMELPSFPILIASQYAYGAIEKAIKAMGLKNDILDLYSN